MKHLLRPVLLCVALLGTLLPAQAHLDASEASALSALPIAVSAAAPSMLLSGGLALTVVAIEASATGTVWVMERASDGARFSVTLASGAVVGASMAVGTAVAVTAISTGGVLSAAGKAIALIPNEIGSALLYNERVSR